MRGDYGEQKFFTMFASPVSMNFAEGQGGYVRENGPVSRSIEG